jgi:DNA ligase-1
MSLKSVHEKLEKLANTNSNLEKERLLAKYLENELFRTVCEYALDCRKVYHITKLPPQTRKTNYSNENIFILLNELANSPGSSKKDKELLAAYASVDDETYDVVTRIVKGDLRCGCGVKVINNVKPLCIFDIPYCRCSKEDKIKNIRYPAIAQEKADGTFANGFCGHSTFPALLSRNGKEFQQLKHITTVLRQFPDNSVLNGELRVCNNDGTLMSRKKGNGILSSCLYGTADQKLANKVVYCVWDSIPLQNFWNYGCEVPYNTRFSYVKSIVDKINSPFLSVIPTRIVHSEEEARAFYREIRKAGGEGIILKDLNAAWRYHTSTKQIKFKNIIDAELRLTGWYFGEPGKKYSHCIGGLSFESECGLLQVNVGTGLSDEERGYKLLPDGSIDYKFAEGVLEQWDSILGAIGQLEAESVIKSKTDKKHSLYLPRFIEIRHDKSKADTLEGLLKR